MLARLSPLGAAIPLALLVAVFGVWSRIQPGGESLQASVPGNGDTPCTVRSRMVPNGMTNIQVGGSVEFTVGEPCNAQEIGFWSGYDLQESVREGQNKLALIRVPGQSRSYRVRHDEGDAVGHVFTQPLRIGDRRFFFQTIRPVHDDNRTPAFFGYCCLRSGDGCKQLGNTNNNPVHSVREASAACVGAPGEPAPEGGRGEVFYAVRAAHDPEEQRIMCDRDCGVARAEPAQPVPPDIRIECNPSVRLHPDKDDTGVCNFARASDPVSPGKFTMPGVSTIADCESVCGNYFCIADSKPPGPPINGNNVLDITNANTAINAGIRCTNTPVTDASAIASSCVSGEPALREGSNITPPFCGTFALHGTSADLVRAMRADFFGSFWGRKVPINYPGEGFTTFNECNRSCVVRGLLPGL